MRKAEGYKYELFFCISILIVICCHTTNCSSPWNRNQLKKNSKIQKFIQPANFRRRCRHFHFFSTQIRIRPLSHSPALGRYGVPVESAVPKLSHVDLFIVTPSCLAKAKGETTRRRDASAAGFGGRGCDRFAASSSQTC